MDGRFSIDIEPARDLVEVVMTGFFTHAVVQQFIEARRVSYRQLRCAPKHLTMNDVSGMKIQHQDIVAEFQAIVADPQYRSRRLAVVVGTSLARMQVRRMTNSRTTGTFVTKREALTWLLASEERMCATPMPRVGGLRDG